MELLNTLVDNRYLINKILGQGGNSRTYLASDTHRFNEQCVLKEFVALEVEPSQLEQFRKFFQQEAKVLHQISHPQIPQLLACFEEQGRFFLVQEYINAQSYSALLEERQQHKQVFRESEIIRWLKHLLPILNYIHQLEIIHGDISPDNILQLPGEKLPMLVDFGIAKAINRHQQAYYNSGQKYSYVKTISFVGKVGYAPREQIISNRYVPGSDLYSLGVTALVLLTGKSPTALLDPASLEWQWQYVRVSRNLAAILSRMTAEKPQDRYQSAKQVLRDLERHYSDLDDSEAETIISVANSSSQAQQPPTNNSTTSHQTPSSNSLIDDRTIILAPSDSGSLTPKTEETLIIDRVDSSSSHLKNFSVDSTNLRTAKIEHTMIISPSEDTFTEKLDPKFVRRCEEKISSFIGEMAVVTVREVIKSHKPQSPEALIAALMEYLPDPNQAQEFKALVIRSPK